MSNKTFYWILAAVAIVIIIIAVIAIKNSNKGAEVVPPPPVIQYDSNGNQLPSPTPPIIADIKGKSVYANPPLVSTTNIWKKSPFVIWTSVPKGKYIGVANKYDSNKSYIEVFIPELFDYLLVQTSQVKLV